MKEISAILIDYTDHSAIDVAIKSLHVISSKLQTVFVLYTEDSGFHVPVSPLNIVYQSFKAGELGKTLNETISYIQSEYVLLLQKTEYLDPKTAESIQINSPQTVLAYTYHLKNITIRFPLLVQTAHLKNCPFLVDRQLPFKEAMLPVWLSRVDRSFISLREERMVKRSKEHSYRSLLEKYRLIEKYQLRKSQLNHPSLSILIANYNMEKYVETAIVSCLLQTERPDQIYIVDDGSTDDSLKHINNWQNEPHVKIFHKQNGGKARALNKVLPHITSEFILELDADDWLDPDAVYVIKNLLTEVPGNTAVLHGNFRKWKQLKEDVLYKQMMKGRSVYAKQDLLTFRFPLAPRIYRTSSLKAIGGFPVITFKDGRLYEDVSVLNRLIETFRFQYEDFTVYNVREHKESITRKNINDWDEFLKSLWDNR